MKLFTPSLLSAIITSISLNQFASAPLGSDNIKSTSVFNTNHNPNATTMNQNPYKSTNLNNELVRGGTNVPVTGEKSKARRADTPEKPKTVNIESQSV